ncbi:MAG: type 2 isopentenyl-diphosphate Delta-isomerase [Deltaproteobacteria bacterium]|nr:MAG: type 2 isopentenyl-diphosphate Delta-isomerase [Deltaproteobacteria bacterium]
MSHSSRKGEHLDLCATDDVAFKGKGTLFDEVELVHDSLPEMAVSEVDLSTRLVGKVLRAPMVIAAMTGGVDRAEAVNKDLASVAEEHGIAFGFGSMRPLLEDGDTTGYLVRDVAPNAVVFGNIGVVQARDASIEALRAMLGTAGCDALCVHLNPAQEVVQPEGDDDFRGGLDTLQRLAEELDVPVIAKETGCGLSRSVGERLVRAGIGTVDVSGAGGTSWVGVETLRARARTRSLGELFWDWGIPTAGSVAQLADLPLDVIATGGMRHGLDIARALALGATAGGMARPYLMAWNDGGRDAASAMADQIATEIRIALLLAGAKNAEELRAKPVILGERLLRWVPAGSSLTTRR